MEEEIECPRCKKVVPLITSEKKWGVIYFAGCDECGDQKLSAQDCTASFAARQEHIAFENRHVGERPGSRGEGVPTPAGYDWDNEP